MKPEAANSPDANRSFANIKAAVLNTTVIVSALGYFVDIYDLVLFSIVRVASLKDLGVPENQLLEVGVYLLNMQMAGMLLGGVIWGVLGDKRGRVSVLFGSIILYSLANIANAFVTSTSLYGVMRFIAGIGLAGELGAAITLVSETLPKHSRGYGTGLVAGIGTGGAILAAAVGEAFNWQVAYVVGGVLGLMLLVLRVRLFDSGIYNSLKGTNVRRGDIRMLFNSWPRFVRYMRCILIGMPAWLVVGVLITFSPEICKELGATGPVSAGTGILCNYAGLVIGDIASGFISQWVRSRKRVVFGFAFMTMVFAIVYVLSHGMSPAYYYFLAFGLGCFGGYWALFVTIAAEQFGTNLRATVAITAPNFVRGSVILITKVFQDLRQDYGLATSALYVTFGVFTITFLALWRLKESYGLDLDYIEATQHQAPQL